MHFFSQHDPETRYDIIKHYVTMYSGDIEAIRRVGEILKNSVYDFHEELQYLKVYSQSVPASLRSVPASAV
jgi:ABC-type sulfate/molybdate transport systems ATPase subunit